MRCEYGIFRMCSANERRQVETQYSHVVHRKEIISDQDPLDHERLHQRAAVMLSILPDDIGPQKPLCARCEGGV